MKSKLMLVAAALASLAPSLLRADMSCSPVRLDAPGGSMAHVPVRDQGPLGICYAEAAAQVMDAYRFSNGDRNYQNLTSSFMTSIYYAEEEEKLNFEGGFLCPALTYTANFGRCDERTLNAAISRDTKRDLKKLISSLKGFYRSYHKAVAALDKQIEESRVRQPAAMSARDKMDQQREQKLVDTSQALLRYLQDSKISPELLPAPQYVTKLLALDNPVFYLKGLLTRACSKNVQYLDFTPPHCETAPQWIVGTKGMAQRLDEALSQEKPLPVGISYCSHVLKKGRSYRGLAYVRNNGGAQVTCRAKDSHASLVIGRRMNPRTNQCEYLVRNTWGTNCSPYSKDWACDGGNVWVERNSLLSNLKAVSVVSRPGR